MSTTVDERVVEMRFDNAQFERATSTTMSTLEKLKQSLNLTGASKGLENIGNAAKNVNMSGLSGAVETVHAKFSALEVMGVTALANITNTAVNAGKRIASALTIDPIKTGFSEYETQINAVQTILANTQSKGSTLDDVNKALDELNTYADKTIYNFTEMTRNIGTFTAAGIDLDTSVNAIQGIANLAAISGSTSQQASTAMYQLSQALASGTVKLMDWNSVVNAGMGGQVFQDALKKTSAELGTGAEAAIEANGSFRESLQTGWLTSEVLTETLKKFTTSGANEYVAEYTGLTTEAVQSALDSAKAQYGEADAIEYASKALAEKSGKNADEIKSALELARTSEDAATKVKTFTQLWDTLKEAAQSGWTQSWEIIVGDFEEAKELMTKVSDTIGAMVNASAKSRNDLLQGWKDGGGRTAIIDALTNAFNGLMSVIKPIKEAFREVFPPIASEQLIKFSNGLKDLTSKFILNKDQSEQLKTTFKGLFSILDIGVTFVKEVASSIAKLFGNLSGFGGGVLSVTSSIGEWLIELRDTVKETDIFGKAMDKVTNFLQKTIDKTKELMSFLKEKIHLPSFEGFLEIMDTIWSVMTKIGAKVSEVASSIGNALANAFRSGDISSGLDVINGGIFATILLSVKKFMGGVTDIFDGAGDILENITGILDSVKGCLESWQQSLKAGILLKIASAIGVLAASLFVIALLDPSKLTAALGAITTLFVDLMGSLAIFNKISGDIDGVGKSVSAMIGVSIAVLILAGALAKLSGLNPTELITGLIGVIILTGTMIGAMILLGKFATKAVKGAVQMVIFAAAVKILASACRDLSSLSWEELAKGLLGVGAFLTEISLFLSLTKFSGKTITTATGIVILSAAIKILASACKDFGSMSLKEIGKGLFSIGVLLGEIAAFTKLTGNAKHVISTGIALVIIGAAMKVFANAMKDFSSFSWEKIAKGLVAMSGALAAVTLAVNGMPKNMIGTGLGLLIVSSALIVLAEAFGQMGEMSWDEIGRGMVVLGGAMLILAVALNAMNGTVAGSAALMIATAALAILTPVLTTLGNMKWENIAKGLIAIAGAFVVIGVAGLVLGPLVPTILSLSAAVALLGVSFVTIGAGLALIALSLTLLATSASAGATAIVAALAIIITGIVGLIPVIIERLGEAIIVFCKMISELAPVIGEAVKALVVSLVDVLVQCIPTIADGALKLIVGVLDSLVQYTPQIVDLIFQFLIELLNGIAAKLPELIVAAMNIISAFFQGIIDALSGIDTSALLNGIVGVGLLSALMIALSAVAGLIPGAMVGVLGMGVVIAELAIVLAAIGGLAQIPGLQWLIEQGGQFLQTIGTAIGQFIGGIVGGIASGITSQLPQIGTDLSNFMTNLQPFIDGTKMLDSSTLSGAKSLADVILTLTAANLLEGITSWFTGGTSLTQFGEELAGFGSYMADYAEAVSGIKNVGAVEASATAAKALAEMANALPNSGGVAGWFAGENDMSTFGDQLVPFGEALTDYSSAVEGLNADAVTNSVTAAKGVAEVANALPNSGGLAGFFAGDNDMNTFGSQLVSFGGALTRYSIAVTGLNTEPITASVTAAKSLTELAETIPNSGGFVGVFTGNNDMNTFGSQLVSFGGALTRYSQAVTGIESGAIVTSVYAARKLVEFINGLSELNTGGIGSFKNAVNSLAATNVNAFVNAFSGASSKLQTIGSNMINSIIVGITSKQPVLTSAVTSVVTGMTKTVSGMNVNLNSIGATLIDNMTKGIVTKKPLVISTMTRMMTELLREINTKKPMFMVAGIEIICQFINGMLSQSSRLSTIMSNPLNNAVTNARGYYNEFYNVGSYLVSGMVNGISANAYKVQAQASAMAKAAATAAEKELGIHSPSRVFYGIGDYAGQGFINALGDYASKTYKAGSNIADSARNGLSKAISQIESAMSEGIDTQPTIRPVIDLDDVKSGVGTINSMLNLGSTIGLSANVGSIGTITNDQNGNSDVIAAINKLRDGLSNVGGSTYIVDGITYDDGSNVSNAVKSLIRTAKIERRI